MIELTADDFAVFETVDLPHGYTVTFYLTADGKCLIAYPPELNDDTSQAGLEVRLAALRAGHAFKAKHTGTPNLWRLH